MNSKLLLLLLSLLPCFMYGQVKGNVVSESEKGAVPFVTVSAFDKNGKFLCGTHSSNSGFFSLDAKDSITKISFQAVGFEKKDTIAEQMFQGDIGTVILQTKVENLKEVVAVADMVSKSASKEVVFITDSLREGTTNAVQLLAKIPGITADWGTDDISVGKDRNVPIIVNGKETNKNYAVSINPKRIKKIEIMRYPTGKFSDYPIVLNLELASDYVGWDIGAVTRNLYSFRNKHSNRESVGANFTYTLPKVNLYGDLNFVHRQTYDVSGYEYYNGSESMIKSAAIDYRNPNESSRNNTGNFSFGIDYKLSKAHTLSLQTWIETKGTNQNELFNVRNVQSTYDIQTEDDFKTSDYTIGLYYNGLFLGKLKTSMDLLYNRYNIQEDRLYCTNEDLDLTPYRGKKNYWRSHLSATYAFSQKFSGVADYTQTWKDYSNSNREEGNLLYNSKESRSKLLCALSYQPFRNLSTMVGTHVLTVKNEDRLSQESESHTSWMPVFKGYYKPVKWMSFLLNYYCDVEYPNLDQLSTVSWQVNDVLWHQGNAGLKHRIMHYSELTVDFANIVKLTYMHKRSKNEIIEYYMQDGEKTYQTQANCNFRHNYIGIEGNYQLAKGLEMSLVAAYQWYHRYVKGDTKHFGRTWYLDTQLLWNVPTTRLNLVASYFLRHDKFPLLQGMQYNEEENLYLGAMYPLLGGKLPISLTVSIPTELISKQTYTKINLPKFNYQMFGDNRVNAFVAQISIKYNFGKGKTAKMDNSKVVDVEK